MNKFFFICFVLAATFNCIKVQAQNSFKSAEKNIILLKEGTLLVRLRTSEPQIKALTRKGYVGKAEEVRITQRQENLRLYEAFKKNYAFSKVLFFFSSETGSVQSGSTSGYFLNSSLEVDSTIKLNTENYFIAEISTLDSPRKYSTDQKDNINEGISSSNVTALLIRDKNFVQLQKPFPYFIRTFRTFSPLRRDEDKLVLLLNEKLTRYYRKISPAH